MAVSQVVVVDGNNLIVRIDRGVAGRGVTDVEPIEIDGSLYLVFTFSDGTTETVGPVGTIQYIGQSPIVVTGSTISLSTVPVTLGGTGQITANAGFNALAPSQTGNSGKYLKTDGTNSAWDLLDISTADITGVLHLANGGTGSSTASGARTNLGLGTIATQDASNVSITGGTITGITDLAVADGGTGASTAAGAMVNLLPSYTGNANKRLGLDGTATGLEWVTDGGGTVTSVDVSGGATGLLFTGGPVTTSGTITLSGTLDVDNGGTGATTAAGARTNLNAADQATTISAGTGLSGGGDLSANRTLSIANTEVTAGAYGSASNTLTATVNAQGQLTALAATPIAISNTQVSGLGTMSTQNSNAVTITGGSITGITDLAIADGGTGASNAADARSNLGLGTAAVLNAGVALGVATLDAGGTVPLSQIPASIQGGVSYQGAWNASTNTPTLTSSVGTKGHYYVVSVAGNTNLNGVTDWLVGDWAIYNGTAWEKIDNTDQVASVNGYTGVVVLNAADVGAPPTTRTISAGTGLTGGGDLSTNRTLSIANTTVSAASYGTASAVPTFTVNGQGQLTAASDVTIAIANTQVSGLGTMSTQNANSVTITGGSITGITDLAIADGGTGASTAGGALTNLGAIGSITSSDGSIIVVPSGTSVDLAVSAASPASTLLTQVRNTTGATLAKGTVVYISGATGQISTVSKAIATGDTTSAQTLGMITADLANNTNGYVTVFGLITNIDTSSYTDGAQLYLSGTTAGAVTTTKPSAPIHLVYVGIVEYAHPTQGKILVKVQNGYELDEIHDVSIVSPVTGQTLVYNSSTDLWVNNTVSLTAGVNGTLPIANGGTGQTTANAAFNALAPSQTGNSGKYLTTDGTDTSWATNPLGTVTSVGGTGTVSGISLSGTVTTSGNLTLGGALDLSSYNGAGAFTTLSASSTVTLSGGTANGVTYLNGSKVLTSGSALTFDGTNLGIGISSPASKLDVYGATNTEMRLSSGTYGYLLFGQYANGAFIGPSSSDATIGVLRLGTVGTERLRIDTSGNVGVGTTSPTSLLSVLNASSGAKADFVQNSTTTGDYTGMSFGVTASSVSGYKKGGVFFERTGAGGIGKLHLANNPLTDTSNVSLTDAKLTIDSAGLVGIGTSSPSTRLHVKSADNTTASVIVENLNSTNGILQFGSASSSYQILGGAYQGQMTYNTGAGTPHIFWIGGSEKLRLDASGNLGLGVTPSAWSASGVLQVSRASMYSSGGFTAFANNWYSNAGDKYIATDYATQYYQSSGQHVWRTAPSGTAGNAITFTQAMTLDASGNLGVGTTSPSSKLHVGVVGGGVIARFAHTGETNNPYAYFKTSEAGNLASLGSYSSGGNSALGFLTADTERARITSDGDFLVKTADARIGSDVGSVEYGTSTANSVRFYTSDLERARIDSSGNLLVGTTTQRGRFTVEQDGAVNDCGGMNNTGSGTSSQSVLSFYRAGTFTGNIANTNAATLYLTSSDYRLKDNTQPLTGSGAFIDALQPKTWDWKAGGRGVGFIAHEVQEVSPNSVTGAKDAVDENGNPKYQSMEYGSADFIANIIAEIQSLRARVAQLETN